MAGGRGSQAEQQKSLRSKSVEEEVTLYSLKQAIVKLQVSFDTHKDDVMKKLEQNSNSIKDLGKKLKDEIKKEIKGLQDYIDGEISRVLTQMNDLEKKIQVIEKKQEVQNEFNEEETIVINSLPHKINENLKQEVTNLFRDGLQLTDIHVVNTKRMKNRDNKPGLVKVQLQDLHTKKRVLNAKTKLKTSALYNKVHIRSSRSHADRLAEQNMRTLLKSMPNGKNFYFTSNGRLIQNNAPEDNPRQTYFSGRGRGNTYGRGRGMNPPRGTHSGPPSGAFSEPPSGALSGPSSGSPTTHFDFAQTSPLHSPAHSE